MLGAYKRLDTPHETSPQTAAFHARSTSRYISNNEAYHVEAMRHVGEQMAELMDAACQGRDDEDVDVVAEADAVKVPARARASRVRAPNRRALWGHSRPFWETVI